MGSDRIRSRIEVTLTDGRTVEIAADERYWGGPDLPLDDAEVAAKFRDCAGVVLSEEAAERLLDCFLALEDRPDLSLILAALATTAPAGGEVAQTAATHPG